MRKMRDPLLSPLAFGDVLVRRDPSAAREWLVHDPDGSSVRRFDDKLGRVSLREIAQQALAIAFDIACEASGLPAMRDQLEQVASGLHDLFAQAVHVDIARLQMTIRSAAS